MGSRAEWDKWRHFVAGDVNATRSLSQDKERLACWQTGAELFLDKSSEANQLTGILKGMIRHW